METKLINQHSPTTFYIDPYYVYTDYYLTQGKTRAFVTFKHAWRFYYCFVGLGGMLLLIVAFLRREDRRFLALALMFSMLATIFPLLELWSYFIS